MRHSLSFFPDTVYNYSHRSINPETRFFNPKLEMHTFESDYPFCSGPRCELHVRAGDTDVHGFGNWAHLPMGASLAAGYMTASFCATRAAARKSERRFEPKPKWRHDPTHSWESGLRASWGLVSAPRLPGSSPDHGAVQSWRAQRRWPPVFQHKDLDAVSASRIIQDL
jgi:hypothetical protein